MSFNFGKRILGIAIVLLTFIVCPVIATPSPYYDDFSNDTTSNYDTYYWHHNKHLNPQDPTINVNYDSSLQRANLTATGGYSYILMTQKNSIPVSVGTDFEFSVDLTIINEYNSSIYLGDMQDTDTSTYLMLNFDVYQQHSGGLRIINAGQTVFAEPTDHSGSSANLKVKRESSTYSFFFDDNLVWQMAIQEFDGMPLHFGVINKITSGASGVTATTAVDNWNFVPEPTALSLLALGGLVLRRRRA